MATPPFLPDETKPADGDVVSQFPAVERTFRDVIETWLLVDHDTAGEHEKITLPELGADPSNVTDTGFLYTKNDGGDTEFYFEDAGGNVVQITQDGGLAVETFPATTSMLFYQETAPAGWTKDTTTLDNHALRVVSSTAWSTGSKGATAFDTVFGDSTTSDGTTITSAQSGIVAHTHGAGSYSAGSGGAHTHNQDLSASGSPTNWDLGENLNKSQSMWAAGSASSDTGIVAAANHSHSLSGTSGSKSAASAVSSHAHTVPLDLNYINVIRCTKN